MLRGSGKPKKQFSRPSVTVSTDALGDGAKKSWQDIVDLRLIEVGDIIVGKGLVVGIGEVVSLQDPAQYRFEFEMKNGTTLRLYRSPHVLGADPTQMDPRDTTRVFTRIRG